MTATTVTSTALTADRVRLVFDIRAALEPLGVTLQVTRQERRSFTLDLAGPRISAMIRVDGASDEEPPLVHWYGAQGRLRAVPGAWYDWNVSQYHRHKATSCPHTFHELLLALVAGFQATSNGSAFQ